MKKTLFFIALFVSSAAFAGTEHYLLRDGNHVHHLKVTERDKEYTVEADVDFEPNADEKGRACSGEIEGDAKLEKDKLIVKKHSETDATSCELIIQLTDTGAKIEQSKDCNHFAAGICHFNSDGKELLKVK